METPLSVLVVEDEALIAMEIVDCLMSLGYAVRAAVPNGERALDEMGRHPVDLVVMDVKLSGQLDGLETAERLRINFDVPVVFLTAFTDSALLRRAGDIGSFGYLVKPFQERELHATIQVAVARHRGEQRLQEANRRLLEAMAKVKRLSGLIPVCSWCRRIRNDQQYWQSLEAYIAENTDARVSHGMCPSCLESAAEASGHGAS